MLRRVLRITLVVLAILALGVLAVSAAGAHGDGDHHARSHDHGKSEKAGSGHGKSRHDKGDRDHGKGDGDGHGHADCGPNGYSAWDEEWLTMSIEGDLFEIQGGNIAQDKGQSDQIKELGARLVQDHSKSLEDATKVAQDLGIEVPHDPSPTQQWELRVVQQFSGNEFDRWYADLEVQDHMQDIKEAQDEIDKGCNDQIRKLAQDDLPVLQEHLSLAQAALEAVGGQPQAQSRRHSKRSHLRHHKHS